ncbi:hypothetical protein SPRG_22312 [Saprolegnia parasitica CBS 223.65]|uniref:Amino acid permease/ SLC12A domain-containing protein n=1 Tax=Saprolegnia parasitica (strain CBS 223.65) TaxID=695850 RepID=A0A067BUM6_SAPPC|nr:hypothetical protein SPRG_22312 [Saprolegnia parasitica CBS 223.65]KDO21983.1 hypothetical protein SPRG_22312 [Saprolegnia parasitica CBS 223.65]|eukprot:XP_012207345.1 hypothetical protein SPRG_22312 [Saprolegnia parasitica CBS 223.65]
MSSVLYSSGIVALKAGKLAPICMAMVSVVLYMYRFIYEEVVTAIPMNGGSYNCLLNTTSKRVAAVAAVLSTLAYTATAVVSGTSACYYLQFVLQANANTVLANLAEITAGNWLVWIVCIDAFVVLSGAVLTSYVGITGLHRRLASDRVMPAFFAAENKWRGTNHWIILAFFLLTSSLVLLLNGDNVILGGVYTYSFLSLMFLFAMGCMMLKIKRQDIPRDVHAPWWACISGATLIAVGYFGILLGDPSVIAYFFYYALGVAVVVFGMLWRVTILRCLIFVLNFCGPYEAVVVAHDPRFFEREHKRVSLLVRTLKAIKEQPFVFFIKSPNLTLVNKVILYVRANEMTETLRFVHVYPEVTMASADTIQALADVVALFDRIYPKLRTDFVSVKGPFEPATIEWLSTYWHMPTNMMFIKQPTNTTVHRVSCCGVRVITG